MTVHTSLRFVRAACIGTCGDAKLPCSSTCGDEALILGIATPPRTPTHDEKIPGDVFKIIPDHRESCVAINGLVCDGVPKLSVCHARQPPAAVENEVLEGRRVPHVAWVFFMFLSLLVPDQPV